MPKTARTTQLSARLAPADRERFERMLKARGMTRTDLVREAVLYYLDNYEQEQEAAKQVMRDKVIVDGLKSIENRFAGLLVRLGVDLESMYALLWSGSPKDTREDLFEKCYQVGQQRFRRKLRNIEEEMRDSLKKQPDTLARLS